MEVADMPASDGQLTHFLWFSFLSRDVFGFT